MDGVPGVMVLVTLVPELEGCERMDRGRVSARGVKEEDEAKVPGAVGVENGGCDVTAEGVGWTAVAEGAALAGVEPEAGAEEVDAAG